MHTNKSKSLQMIYIAASALLLLSCADSHQHYEESKKAVERIHALLISRGYCADVADCQRKEFVKYEAAHGVHLNVYGLKDGGAKEVTSVVCEEHNKNLDVEYRISIFASQKSATQKITVSETKFPKDTRCQ